MDEEIKWSNEAISIFHKIIDNLPQFHRNIAKKLVKESAEEIVRIKGSNMVREEDLIKAFFKEVPPAFKEMMLRRLRNLKIDYAKYIDE